MQQNPQVASSSQTEAFVYLKFNQLWAEFQNHSYHSLANSSTLSDE